MQRPRPSLRAQACWRALGKFSRQYFQRVRCSFGLLVRREVEVFSSFSGTFGAPSEVLGFGLSGAPVEVLGFFVFSTGPPVVVVDSIVSSSESLSMYSATSLKSVVPIHDPCKSLCAFARVVQSSMILNVLPDAKNLPLVILIFFNGVFALGPPATLNGVNKTRRPDRCTRVQRPSCPSFAHESTWRSSAFSSNVRGIRQFSKCRRFNSLTGALPAALATPAGLLG